MTYWSEHKHREVDQQKRPEHENSTTKLHLLISDKGGINIYWEGVVSNKWYWKKRVSRCQRMKSGS